MTEEKLLNYFFEIEKLKKTKRYAEYDEVFSESVTDHSFFVCLLGIKLMEQYKLKLNFEKVVKMSLYHDLCEINLKTDFDAYLSSTNKSIKEAKKEYEKNTILKLANNFKQSEIIELFEEYEKQKTAESRFVKALDKLETTIHIINTDSVKIKNEEFAAKYCDNAIANFPELKPFYKLIKTGLKQCFDKDGLVWKEEYWNY